MYKTFKNFFRHVPIADINLYTRIFDPRKSYMYSVYVYRLWSMDVKYIYIVVYILYIYILYSL